MSVPCVSVCVCVCVPVRTECGHACGGQDLYIVHALLWLEAAQADPVHSFSEYRVSARANEPLFHSFALGGYSLPVSHVCRGEKGVGQPLWLRRASAASRYCSALMAWALRARAPAASLITASRSALGAEGAARLCIGRGSRWLPSPTRATR